MADNKGDIKIKLVGDDSEISDAFDKLIARLSDGLNDAGSQFFVHMFDSLEVVELMAANMEKIATSSAKVQKNLKAGGSTQMKKDVFDMSHAMSDFGKHVEQGIQGGFTKIRKEIRGIKDEAERVKKIQEHVTAVTANAANTHMYNVRGKGVTAGSSFAINMARATQDAQMFHQSFLMGLMSIQNNLDMIFMDYKEILEQTGTHKGALKEIGRTMMGPLGIVTGMNLAMTMAQLMPVAIKKISEWLDSAASNAKKLADAIKEARISSIDLSSQGASDIQDQYERALELEKTLKKEIQQRSNQIGYIESDLGGKQYTKELRKEVDGLNDDLLETIGITGELQKKLAELTGSFTTKARETVFGPTHVTKMARETEEKLEAHELELLRITEMIGGETLSNKREQFKEELRLRVDKLRQEAALELQMAILLQRSGKDHTDNTILAGLLFQRAAMIESNMDKILANVKISGEKVKDRTSDILEQLFQMDAETRKMEIENQRESTEQKLSLIDHELEMKMHALETERASLVEMKAEKDDLAKYDAERVQREVALRAWAEKEKLRIEKDAVQKRREADVRAGQAGLDVQSALAGTLPKGLGRDLASQEIDHKRTLFDLESQINDEMAKEDHDRNLRVVDSLRSRIDAEKALHAQRQKDLLDADAKAWDDMDQQIAEFAEDGTRKLEERHIRRMFKGAERERAVQLMRERNAATDLTRQREALDREVQDRFDASAKAVEDEKRRDDELEAIRLAHENAMTDLARRGEDERGEIRRQGHRDTLEKLMQGSNGVSQMAGHLSQGMDTMFQVWMDNRVRQLVNQGLTEEEAQDIAEKQGKKRFERNKKLAQAEAWVSGLAMAMNAAHDASRWGGLVAGIAAFGAAMFFTRTQVAAIGAQQLGGGGSSGGFSGGGLGAGVGASGSVGSGGSSISAAVINPLTFGVSQNRAAQAASAPITSEIVGLRNDLNKLMVAYADRPVEAVMSRSTAVETVRQGQGGLSEVTR